MKRIFKFSTGDKVPENAIYLSTIANEFEGSDGSNDKAWGPRNDQRRMVYHYFLIEV